MPPNALYDVLCVVHSLADIAARAAAIQARQTTAAAQRRAGIIVPAHPNLARDEILRTAPASAPFTPAPLRSTHPPRAPLEPTVAPVFNPSEETASATVATPAVDDILAGPFKASPLLDEPILEPEPAALDDSPPPLPLHETPKPPVFETPFVPLMTAEPSVTLTASKVPSSQIGRLFHYGSLAAGLGMGAASEMLRRSTRGSETEHGSLLLSANNVNRLVDKLSKMRGAALKLGQFMSIQDSHMLPEQLEGILRRVQASAHYMPNWQMEQVMATDLGPDWRSDFESFEAIPFASASIGQVHRAVLAPHVAPHLPFREVAVKVQFPNIKNSIRSDLKSLSLLLYTSRLLPRGLFLDKTLAAMEEELEDECDYLREAESSKVFHEGLKDDSRFTVMRVVDELCSKNVLTMERLEGVPIIRVLQLPQEKRDQIATNVLSLCLRELFGLRFMQTDPNWSNFLYNQQTDKIELIDFGASRPYSKEFMDDWYMLLGAAIRGDRDGCHQYSLKLHYLTGEESPEMLDAHIQSLLLLGLPFANTTSQPYSFAPSPDSPTSKIRELIPFMLKHRLTPPPRETYSLNRKLSGAFLLCERLGASIDCRAIWERETGHYRVGEAL